MVTSLATSTLRVSFLCGLRGYHEYRTVWNPVIDEVLSTRHERNNIHDRYAIAAIKLLPGTIAPSIIGHLPKEISRLTYFIINRGATVRCRVISEHHRHSPLIQGGLEIPVEVVVEMPVEDSNAQTMQKYESLVQKAYKEPASNTGMFEDATEDILKELFSEGSDSDSSDEDPIDDSQASSNEETIHT